MPFCIGYPFTFNFSPFTIFIMGKEKGEMHFKLTQFMLHHIARCLHDTLLCSRFLAFT